MEDWTGWGELLAAGAVFLLTHSVPARPAVRSRLIALAGRGPYLLGYAIVSVVVLAWLLGAAARTPFIELWAREEWQNVLPAAGMLAACLLLVFGLASPNPLSIAGRRSVGFDPRRPGIVGIVRHPVLWAALLWSATHLGPNGDLSHVLLFGLFAVFSVVGMLAVDRRRKAALGEARWHELARHTSNLPFFGLLRGGWRPAVGIGTVARLAGGLALYLALILAHGWLAGIPLVG